MKNPIRVPLSLLMGSSLAAFGIGYMVAPTEQLDTEVTESGLVSATTTQVLSATVESLRAENKLQVFTYKGAAKVWTCNGLVPITCLSLRHLSFESQGAYAAQI